MRRVSILPGGILVLQKKTGGDPVEIYIDLVALLNFAVDLLLLLGTNRLCGYPPGIGKAALAAAVGGVYGAVCLLPGMQFLANMLWRIVFLGLISWIAFGTGKSALHRAAIFVLLCMAMGGAAAGIGGGSFLSLVFAAVCVAVICVFGFRGKVGGGSYIPVEISYKGKRIRIMALQDTGNTLRDPITGQSVLVVGADVARELTGLTAEQLGSPLEVITAGVLPGLRLIPYRAVGKTDGMLLALRLPEVKIGTRKGSGLVAFAPEGLGSDGAYQALTGGAV